MFVGRKQELRKLETMYESNQFECVVIYSRRRVDKTTLINEFIWDKESIFFTGLEMGERENLESLSRSIMEFQFSGTEAPVFQSSQSALDAVHDMAKEKCIVLAIDEYPYLADSYKSFSSLLQKQIDGKYKNSKLFLIPCGSSLIIAALSSADQRIILRRWKQENRTVFTISTALSPPQKNAQTFVSRCLIFPKQMLCYSTSKTILRVYNCYKYMVINKMRATHGS